jgi:hypothetical protein
VPGFVWASRNQPGGGQFRRFGLTPFAGLPEDGSHDEAPAVGAESMSTFMQEVRQLSELLQRGGEGEGIEANRKRNPVERLPDWRTTLPLAQSCPRCGAKTRRGSPCQSPAMRGKKRCRLHGG